MNSTERTRTAGTLRARNRAARRGAFLDAARWIVAAEGIDALTMQRLAIELDCGVGSIYRYFPSKGALVAAIQHEQLETLRAALTDGQDRFAGALGRGGDGTGVVALARVLVVGRLWIEAARSLPAELALVRQLVATSSPSPDAEALVDVLRLPLEAAVGVGALAPGADLGRVRVIVAALGDVALAAGSAGDAHPDDARLGEQLLGCLLVAWGADPGKLVEADRLLAQAPT